MDSVDNIGSLREQTTRVVFKTTALWKSVMAIKYYMYISIYIDILCIYIMCIYNMILYIYICYIYTYMLLATESQWDGKPIKSILPSGKFQKPGTSKGLIWSPKTPESHHKFGHCCTGASWNLFYKVGPWKKNNSPFADMNIHKNYHKPFNHWSYTFTANLRYPAKATHVL